MNINFSTNPQLAECQLEFNRLAPEDAIVMSHYDLAIHTSIHDPSRWIEFLKDVRVKEVLNTELELFKSAQQRKLIARATENDKSVGTAQMINALTKASESDSKGGQMFIYSYVPLNTKEVESPSVTAETTDVFEHS